MKFANVRVLFVLATGIAILMLGCTGIPASSHSAPLTITPLYLVPGLTTATGTRTPFSISSVPPQAPIALVPSSPSPGTTATAGRLPPPLAAVNFPSQPIPYPADWHADLRYPNQFLLVETTSGISPSGKKGWAVKLVFQGDARNAANLLSDFFVAKGWQTLERTELDSKGFLLLFQRGDKQHTGAIVIDPDTQRPGYVKIVATVFP